MHWLIFGRVRPVAFCLLVHRYLENLVVIFKQHMLFLVVLIIIIIALLSHKVIVAEIIVRFPLVVRFPQGGIWLGSGR